MQEVLKLALEWIYIISLILMLQHTDYARYIISLLLLLNIWRAVTTQTGDDIRYKKKVLKLLSD